MRAAVVKSAVQLLTPIALVRLLSQEEFGEFRLIWLVANTATLVLPLGMARSLLYFLPKSAVEECGRYVSQTAFYFFAVALLVSMSLLVGRYWLPDSVTYLTEPRWVLAAFAFLWVASSPVRYLPNADQDAVWQARAIIAIAILRALAVLGTAVVFKDIQAVFLGLVVWSTLQFLIMVYYILSRYGSKLTVPRYAGLREQLWFAAPFGLAQTLGGARRAVAQWIVVFLFSPAALGIFAIGASFNAILNLVRSSLGNVLLPKISKSHAGGDTKRAVELNNRGNVAVFVLVAPTICWLWTYAAPVVSLMYTENYIAAVPVVRVYLITLLLMSVELGSVLMVLKQGRFVLTVSTVVLLGSSLLSYAGGYALGLWGVALGSLAGEFVGRTLNFARAARELKIRFSDLQDWGTLAKILFASTAAAVFSSYVGSLFDIQNRVASLLFSTAVFALTYVALALSVGLGWLVPILMGQKRWQ